LEHRWAYGRPEKTAEVVPIGWKADVVDTLG
jgi:hypothetical protein